MTAGLSLVALAIAAATATFVLIIREIHIRALDSAGVKSRDGPSWPVSTLPRHDRLVFIARHAVSALLRCGKSGTTANDPSIVRFQSSSNLADLDRCQNCQHVLVPDHCLAVSRSFLGSH